MKTLRPSSSVRLVTSVRFVTVTLTCALSLLVGFSTAHAAAPDPDTAAAKLRAEFVRLRNIDPTTDNPTHRDTWLDLVGKIEKLVADGTKDGERLRVDGAESLVRLWRAERDRELLDRALDLLNPVITEGKGRHIGDAAILRAELALASGEGEGNVRRWISVARRSGTVDPGRVASFEAGLELDLYDDFVPSPDLEIPRIHPNRGSLRRAKQPIVVLDPGHGGDDSGAVGVRGLLEKDVTLDIALRTRRYLEKEGVRVVLTRDRDTFISLARRTAIANRRGAEVFLSLHNNASPSHEVHGLETYYLDNTDDQASKKLAERENSVVSAEELDDLSFILSDLIQSGKLEDSIRLSRIIDDSLTRRVVASKEGLRSLGVKRAPFFVLVGAHMPCALVEMFFVDHPNDGGNLTKDAFRESLASATAQGVVRFLRGEEATKRGSDKGRKNSKGRR